MMRRLCVFWFSVLLFVPLALSDEECAASLLTAQNERSALSAQLKTEQERVITLTTTLQEKEKAVAQLHDEAEALKGKAEASAAQLEEKTQEGSQCAFDLSVSKGAEKQLEVELATAFARIQMLAAEIKQLTKLADELRGSVEEKEKIATIAIKRAALAESELAAQREQMTQSGTDFAALLAQTADGVVELLSKLSPYWAAFKTRTAPFVEAILASPYVAQVVDWSADAVQHSKDAIAGWYAKASPHLARSYEILRSYTEAAVEQINALYTAVKPTVQSSFQLTQSYAAQSWSLIQSTTFTVVSQLRALMQDVLESQFVAEVSRLSHETVEELVAYFQSQMQQMASLQPFAKREYVLFIVYSLLALPPLFLLMLFLTCSSKKSDKKTPIAPSATQQVQKKSKQSQKKAKKGRVVNVGGDVVRYGA